MLKALYFAVTCCNSNNITSGTGKEKLFSLEKSSAVEALRSSREIICVRNNKWEKHSINFFGICAICVSACWLFLASYPVIASDLQCCCSAFSFKVCSWLFFVFCIMVVLWVQSPVQSLVLNGIWRCPWLYLYLITFAISNIKQASITDGSMPVKRARACLTLSASSFFTEV